MAKDSSFDVVSETDMQEVSNAVNNAVKAIRQRYDLKGSGSEIELDKAGLTVTVRAPDEFTAGQVRDILDTQLAKRGVELSALSWGGVEESAGATVRQTASIAQGIEQDIAKRINKDIKGAKRKVKVTIESDKLRISSSSKDELQATIAFLRSQDYGIPLQYVNYR